MPVDSAKPSPSLGAKAGEQDGDATDGQRDTSVLSRGQTAVADIDDPEEVDAEPERSIEEDEEPQKESWETRTPAKDTGWSYARKQPVRPRIQAKVGARPHALLNCRPSDLFKTGWCLTG